MRLPTILRVPHRLTHRLMSRLGPLLLCAALSACGGGGVSVGLGYSYFDDDYDDPPHGPGPGPAPPPAETGVFLIAGGLCPQCGGSQDGSGSNARFDGPEGIVAAPDGNLYVAESTSATIREVSAAGAVTTLAGAPGQCGSVDGNAGAARFCSPQGITLDRQGNLYVADTLNHTIRRIDRANNVTTIAGVAGSCGSSDGRGNAARFCEPQDIEVDEDGWLYVADTANSTIREISPSGEVRTLAGAAGQCGSADGAPGAARFCRPAGLTIDGAGNLFVADTGNGTIRRIGTNGAVATVIGLAGSQSNVLGPLPGGLNAPRGIAVLGAGTLVATSQNLVLKLVPR